MLGKLSFGSRIPPEQTHRQRVVEYKKIIHFSFFLEEREGKEDKDERSSVERTHVLSIFNGC